MPLPLPAFLGASPLHLSAFAPAPTRSHCSRRPRHAVVAAATVQTPADGKKAGVNVEEVEKLQTNDGNVRQLKIGIAGMFPSSPLSSSPLPSRPPAPHHSL